jgi:sigma-E factor negative regulatory protein RseA
MNDSQMNNDSRENLSSFIDGEVDKSAAGFLVRRLANDDVLKATWDRYHMIRDCMRQQDAQLVQADLCSRVRQAIDLEDSEAVAVRRQVGWLKPVAGMAIAASVAMVAILNVGPGRQSGPDEGLQGPAMAAQSEPFVSPNIGNAVPPSQPVNLSGQRTAEQDKAKAYLLRHYQVTGDGAGQGFVALVPVVVAGENAAGNAQAENSDSAEGSELPPQQ